MRPFDLPVTFRERAWDDLKWALVCAGFTVAGLAFALADGEPMSWFTAVFFGAGTVLLGAKTFRRGELVVDEEGVTATGLHRPWSVEWGWVDEFVVATQHLPRGMRQSYVGVLLNDDGVEAKDLGALSLRVTNHLAGADFFFPSTSGYGQDLDALVGRLNATLEARRADHR